MAEKIKLVQGDTKPQIKCVITDENTGDIINLAGATVLLKFRATGSANILFTLTGYLQSGLEDAIKKLEQIPEISFVTFSNSDIVRHSLISKIVKAYDVAK